MSRLLGEPPKKGTASGNRNVLLSQKPNFRGTVAAIILAFVASVLPSPLSDSPALASQAGVGKKVAVGAEYSLAIDSEGRVFAWGNKIYGQLGDGTTTTQLSPVPVTTSGVLAGQSISSVAAGSNHSVALSSTGEIYTWGRNNRGQLGDGTTTNRSVPVQLTRSEAIAGVSFSAISAGEAHTLALSDDGRVFGWGRNDDGRLGDGTTTTPRKTAVAVITSSVLAGVSISAIATGNAHSLALSSDGRVFSWGSNSHGQLGDGTTTQRTTPVAVITFSVPAGVTVVAIAANGHSSYALGSNGRVYSWGFNGNLELGDGTRVSRLEPVAVTTSGVLNGVSISAISAGSYGGFALDTEGRAYSWGSIYTSYGYLGDGGVADGTMPVAVTTSGVLASISISALATGVYNAHQLAIGSDNKLYSWGRGINGQLGDGSSVNRNEPVAVLSGLSFSALEAALTPTFATPTKTSDGYTVQVANYDANFTWNVSASAGSAAIGGSGLISVTGLSAGSSSTVTVQTTRTGYTAGSATTASSALDPAPSGDSAGEQGAQAAAYSGPTFDAAKTGAAGSEVTFTGRRLQLVSSAYAGQLQLQIVQAVSSSLTVFIPTSLSANVYDLTVHSSNGKLTFQQGLTVLGAQDQIVGSEAGPKLTVGSFKGYVAIYTKGYEDQRLSAKVAGKWLVVDSLDESWRGYDYSRSVRYTGAGFDILVHLYIDGQFVKTEKLTTR
jgi:alpha-tubulin suppressor-like RCC1 family protein